MAILANGTLFGLLHFSSHPGDVLSMLPDHAAVSAVDGGLTWAANSILPALVLHSAGDIAVLTRWWLTGRPEWQIGATTPPLVWEGGLDWPLTDYDCFSRARSSDRSVSGALWRQRMAAFATPPPSENIFAAGGTAAETVHP